MIHAFSNVFLFRHLDGLGDHSLNVIVVVTYEFLGPQILEVFLDLREGQLDWVVPVERKWVSRW